MKLFTWIVVALIFVCVSASSLAQEQSLNDTPKLPVYMAIGYNILKGNPLSNNGDIGFVNPILKITYNEGQVTQDNKYLVPDGFTHRLVSSCSFNSEVSEYRGTQSYEAEILKNIEAKQGESITAFSTAFSLSQNYKNLEKATLTDKMTITHAKAICQAYFLSLDLFKNHVFEPSFVSAVNMSYNKNDWTDFITIYGTHFVTYNIMGARAIQEITYSSEAISTLKNLKIDPSVAAKYRFAKTFADNSVDWNKHDAQIKYSELMNNQSREIYVGGPPLKDGNFNTWQKKAYENPMPIHYSVVEMTEVFNKIQDPYIQRFLPMIKSSFVQGVGQYCFNTGCRTPTKDLPQPPAASVEISKTIAVGNTHSGSPFQWFSYYPTSNIKNFYVHHNTSIHQIWLGSSDDVTYQQSPRFGNKSFPFGSWEVPKGEKISKVKITTSSSYIRGFQLTTDKGSYSPKFGAMNYSITQIEIPQGYRVIGIHGTYSSSRVYSMGFVLGRTVYPNNEEYPLEVEDKNELSDIVKLRLE